MVIKQLFKEFGEEVIKKYIQENVDYYLNKWKLMELKNSKISWNWAGFFLVGFWMLYRKMYLYFFILLLTYIVFNIIFSIGIYYSSIFTIFSALLTFVIIPIFVGLFGNYLYAKDVYRKLKSFKSISTEEKDLERIALLKGGISWVAPLFFMFFGFFISTPAILLFFAIPHYIENINKNNVENKDKKENKDKNIDNNIIEFGLFNYKNKSTVLNYAEPVARYCAMDIIAHCVEYPNSHNNKTSKLEYCHDQISSDGKLIKLEIPETFNCDKDGNIVGEVNVIAKYEDIDKYVALCKINKNGIICSIEENN